MHELEWLAKLAKGATIRTHRLLEVAPKSERQTGRYPNTNCLTCGGGFYARPYVLRKGGGKFCSSICYSEWRARTDK